VIELEQNTPSGARICVIGVGGGGGNAINSMINRGVSGVEFIAANTDVQALQHNLAPVKIQLGKSSTRGLGAGADPSVGSKSVEESIEEIKQILNGADMVFVTAGMGGGTGTGAAPVVARIARELGALVVGIVTKPFKWEASKRCTVAEKGVEELRKNVDSLIVIPNQRLMAVIDKHTSLRDAFQRVDEVLCNATRGISDIISDTGYINVDFADVRTIMKNTGDAMMGTGIAKGENRCVEAAQLAISSPLLDGVSIQGAQGVLVNVTGGSDMTMYEVGEAVALIQEVAGSETNLIQGVVLHDAMGDSVMVTVVATGFNQALMHDLHDLHAAQPQAAMQAVDMMSAMGTMSTMNAASSAPSSLAAEASAAAVASAANGMSVVNGMNVANVNAPHPDFDLSQQHTPQAAPAHTAHVAAQQQPLATFAINKPTNVPQRTIPTSSPSGIQELQKYDEPAFKRRLGINSIRINKLDSDVDSDEAHNEDQASKPAFLRRIMD
jgi:cell division protein FtsZ